MKWIKEVIKISRLRYKFLKDISDYNKQKYSKEKEKLSLIEKDEIVKSDFDTAQI